MRQKGGRTLLVISLAVILSVMTLYLYRAVNQGVKNEEPAQKDVLREKPAPSIQGKYEADSTIPKDRIGQSRKKIAIIIDDIGYDLSPLNELLEIDASLTFAILPHCAHSVDAANILYSAKREILLHLPMEPHTFPDENPGVGALFVGMNDQQIKDEVDKDLSAIPHLSGVNNHMGSKFMENEAKLAVVFRQIKERNLFFVDSRTTPLSQGPAIARKLGLRFISRNIFIDNDNDYITIFRNLTNRIDREFDLKSESVVMIGHPHQKTIQALREAIPVLQSRGIDIVPVSTLVR
ncbi:MAG TPA: divergent polysaccharide deacetylase family protein [Syntrophales bacterium]|nr:divergent polysaccharide deacetylase family protein [Syntrophales bacterium]